MKKVYEKLLKEIEQTQDSIIQLEDDFWKEKMKYGKPSTARLFHHNQDVNKLRDYMKGLIVAKAFIESEMNK